MLKDWFINEDIQKASTLPGSFYKNEAWFELSKEKIFARTWQYAADVSVVEKAGTTFPFTLLENVLDEPLLLTRDVDHSIYCLSNVCTHRAKILVEHPEQKKSITCGYHGRCFHLNGHFKSMPKFEGVKDFPSEKDNLTRIPFSEWMKMLFVSLDPAVSLEEVTMPIRERLKWLPLQTLEFVPESSKDYYVNAHWALYCDNYLEGFHIPFVHPALNKAIEFKEYTYEVFPYCNLQIGKAGDGEPRFDIPSGSPDHGKSIYAYYWWVFPNLMFNFYPWGLSVNVVIPLGREKTKISFRTYRFSEVPFTREQNNLDQTELEDEEVVESAQKGVNSRYYGRGRFSPAQEKGVHHFHRLLEQFLSV